ncbi:sensor histidine kinase CssS [Clostridium tepidiprofundi DSM 19306]|uniref:histidine kinase n=1 Tax=Clostridium tepidiprofundi DSM 19306 TaxID=1121338 RepID=A0A151B6Q2_9CLOT|nr:HAMP domain-containing sensor histidine kinase [Clostridium tepidiprofundi]KYH35460.1 sensor histidine kinase CssS [Clostridium tepidiprofundi DSM 19306]
MKNKSLAVQIWGFFTAIVLIILIAISILLFVTIKKFFTDESYNTIYAAQRGYIQLNILGKKRNKFKRININNIQYHQDIRRVINIKYPFDSEESRKKFLQLLKSTQEAKGFLRKIDKQINSQSERSKRYVEKINGSDMFYIITKYNHNGESGFVLSYMWNTYSKNLIKTLFSKLIIIIFIAFFISLAAALIIAKYLTKPLKILERNVKKIADKEWYEPIIIDREDEIGRLSDSVEEMRKELVKRDEMQQNMLQHISHELKTPVMVIRSYAQSVEDGIFPKGNLENTMKVIDSEAERLQKRIRDLLYLTKLEYMSRHETPNEEVNMKNIIENVVERFKYSNTNIKWNIELEDIKILGKRDQWKVVVENILDNQMRYAKEYIDIILKTENNAVFIKFNNDGEHIPEEKIGDLFNQFEKGNKGKFGLGLTIVKQIVEKHGGNIEAYNEKDGVTFCIRVPLL